MTDKEKAIVMAYTGKCMLTGDKFQIFHKYIEDIMGRPIMTHEIGLFADAIKEKSKADFIALCADESDSENPNGWIPVSERLPEENDTYEVTLRGISELEGITEIAYATWLNNDWLYHDVDDWQYKEVIAWKTRTQPYRAESEDNYEIYGNHRCR